MLPINKKISLVNWTYRNTIPKYIVIHYVGGVSTAANNASYFYSTYRGASANYFVDERSIWQVVEDKNTAWHCGSKNGVYYHKECRNNNSIGIEMCCKKTKNGTWYFEEKTIDNTIELVKYLMKKYNIPIKNVIRHYDVTHKRCPEPYVRDVQSWNKFKNRIVNNSSNTNVNNTTSTKISARQFALDVWNKGKYGNGKERKDNAKKLGVDYTEAQRLINILASGGKI